MKHIDHDYLHECLEYRNGELFWKHRPLHHFKNQHGMNYFNGRFGGTKAGCLKKKYSYVRVGCKEVLVHRVIYIMHHKIIPENFEIDHINGDRNDNRIENLRVVNKTQQLQNRGVFKNSLSGITGVYSTKTKWRARITVASKHINLGSFDTKEEAIAARLAGARKYFGEFARTKSD